MRKLAHVMVFDDMPFQRVHGAARVMTDLIMNGRFAAGVGVVIRR